MISSQISSERSLPRKVASSHAISGISPPLANVVCSFWVISLLSTATRFTLMPVAFVNSSCICFLVSPVSQHQIVTSLSADTSSVSPAASCCGCSLAVSPAASCCVRVPPPHPARLEIQSAAPISNVNSFLFINTSFLSRHASRPPTATFSMSRLFLCLKYSVLHPPKKHTIFYFPYTFLMAGHILCHAGSGDLPDFLYFFALLYTFYAFLPSLQNPNRIIVPPSGLLSIEKRQLSP